MADAWDLVPGFFTLQTPANAAAPYPTVESSLLHNQEVPPLPQLQQNAPTPDKTKLATALAELAQDPEMTGKVSAIVTDVATGEILAEMNPTRPVAPASVNKLLTATAVLAAFDPDKTLQTETKYADGTVYLIGEGDVLLAADEGNPEAVIGRAGLGDLARKTATALKDAGHNAVRLSLDTSLFAAESFPSDAETETEDWVMEASPIAVDRNLNSAGEFIGAPKMQAVQIFAEKLRAAGVEVQVADEARTPESAQNLASVESASVRDLVDLTLRESDNTLAETLGHLVAVQRGETADFAGASAAVLAQLQDLGLNVDGVELVDSSGLSESNQLTATLVGQILSRIGSCTHESCASLLSALPVAKLDGTLATRFNQLDLGGKVRAKTGSLGSVTSMAGLLYTQAGRELSFVIIVDDVPNDGAYSLRPLIDATIAKIAAA